MKFLKFLIAALFIYDSQSITLPPVCRYLTITNGSYDCRYHDWSSLPDSLNQTEVSLNSNDEVNILRIHFKTCPQLPKESNSYLQYIQEISIHDSLLEEITSDDLKPFHQLKTLKLTSNKLKKLDADLFKYSASLSFINLSNNHINHVGEKILNPLKKLKTFLIEGNDCINVGFTRITIRQLFWLRCELAINCTEPRNFNVIN